MRPVFRASYGPIVALKYFYDFAVTRQLDDRQNDAVWLHEEKTEKAIWFLFVTSGFFAARREDNYSVVEQSGLVECLEIAQQAIDLSSIELTVRNGGSQEPLN